MCAPIHMFQLIVRSSIHAASLAFVADVAPLIGGSRSVGYRCAAPLMSLLGYFSFEVRLPYHLYTRMPVKSSSLLLLRLVVKLVWHFIAIIDLWLFNTKAQASMYFETRAQLRCLQWTRTLPCQQPSTVKNSYLLTHEECVQSIPTDLTLMNLAFVVVLLLWAQT